MGKSKAIALGTALSVVAAGTLVLITNREAVSNIPVLGAIFYEPARCPLSGVEPRRESVVERPAVAVKIENAAIAYPLAGLEDAEIVYEELVEGGATRFMAIYHCTDSAKAGPVRSARAVDPAIMAPTTKILAYSGANDPVEAALAAAGIVRIDEDAADGALERIPREGLSLEHTLYARTAPLRKLGRRAFADAPPDRFEFGEWEGRSKAASSITINFSASSRIGYEWSGRAWLRTQNGSPLLSEDGEQISVDNVLIEEHDVNLSEIVDVTGTPSPEIADVTGSGRAVLFRDGRAVVGRWERDSADDAVVFKTRSGEVMVLSPGSTWIELVPSKHGEAKGSFSFEK